MNSAKIRALLKEWRQLAAERKSIDYREARWAHKLRAEYPSGNAGDKSFHHWLEVEIDMPPKEREQMLDKARAFKITSDQATWDAQGNQAYLQICKIMAMPRKDQVVILNAAKDEGRKIGAIILARARAQVAQGVIPIRAHERGIGATQGDAFAIKRWACQLSADVLADVLVDRIVDGTLVAPLHVVAAANRRVAATRTGRKKTA